MSTRHFPLQYASAAVALALSGMAMAQGQPPVQEMQSIQVLGTAEDEIKESLGVSVIRAEDIERRPVTNDLADMIRREPGVNLTDNRDSGSRGTKRQIDVECEGQSDK